MGKQVFIKPLNEEVETHAKFLKLSHINDLKDVPWEVIRKSEDESKAVSQALKAKKIILSFENDVIIPLENIIAKIDHKAEIFAHVTSFKEAKIALETLEIGADGVVLETSSPDEISQLLNYLELKININLVEAIVTQIKPLGMGYRVCVDTTEIMKEGEGLLVGSSSSGLILVEAEVKHNEFVASRPFRVNSGAVSLYTLLNNNKTQYLNELSAGNEVLIVNRNGKARTSYVARSKIEKRPLMLIEAKVDDFLIKGVFQNAETIRFVQKNGSICITDIQISDKILVRQDTGGRHFGMKVENEIIIEK
ncbi:MAG: 3-dehydroquinate synthase [Candidatus Heimdallarchaeota archaeon LC_3]|nr:MAG: 3-dehydroquinate synthase [Candidatus Heimdallarchaeota archaeon LC_3]